MSIMNCFLELISPKDEIWIQQRRGSGRELNSYRTIRNHNMRFILIIHIFIKDIFKMKRLLFSLTGLLIFYGVKGQSDYAYQELIAKAALFHLQKEYKKQSTCMKKHFKYNNLMLYCL